MTLYFEDEGNTTLDLPLQELAEQVIKAVLDDAGCPFESDVNLLLTTNEEIHKMNREFRHIDRPTDVLSFPMIDYPSPADFSFPEEAEDCFNPETGELMLGDIVISKEKVLSQAEEYGHSIKREYAFLIAHSVLHLIGYDHIEENDRIMMEEKQKQILTNLQIIR